MKRRARQQRVQQAIGASVEFDAHPRPDIDAIFVAGYQSVALRQINSQLLFNNAGDLPTYITQDGVSADSGENRDLKGMRVLATPWELDSIGPVADLRAATETQWSSQGQRQSRYFAFGYDAATLTMAIRRGSTTWPLAGPDRAHATHSRRPHRTQPQLGFAEGWPGAALRSGRPTEATWLTGAASTGSRLAAPRKKRRRISSPRAS